MFTFHHLSAAKHPKHRLFARAARHGWVVAALVAAAGPAWASRVLPAPEQAGMISMLRTDAARHEHGEGVQKDAEFAAALYCEAARLGDAESQFALGWLYANGRGVRRNDGWASYFFEAAARQGITQADRMLEQVGGPGADTPPCMRDVDPPSAAPAAAAAADAPPLKPPRNYAGYAPKSVLELVRKMAPQFKVEPQLALAIISAESNFDTTAVSPKNARGLMQLIPETAERFNVTDPFDAKQNIRGGLTYLRWLLAYFEGDLTLVAAAYNAGEGTVDRYLGVPPFAETRAYVKRVIEAIGSSHHDYDKRAALPSLRLAAIRAATPSPR